MSCGLLEDGDAKELRNILHVVNLLSYLKIEQGQKIHIRKSNFLVVESNFYSKQEKLYIFNCFTQKYYSKWNLI